MCTNAPTRVEFLFTVLLGIGALFRVGTLHSSIPLCIANIRKMLGNISDCVKKIFLHFTALSVLAWIYMWIILSESISLQHISIWTWKYSIIVIWMTLISMFFKTDICMSDIVLFLDLFIKWTFSIRNRSSRLCQINL